MSRKVRTLEANLRLAQDDARAKRAIIVKHNRTIAALYPELSIRGYPNWVDWDTLDRKAEAIHRARGARADKATLKEWEAGQ